MAKSRSSGRRVARRVPGDYQVFISPATADKWLARTLCEKIEGTGATTFRDDRDIQGGEDIPEEIRRQIKLSKELVVLLTPESANRPWVLLEVGAAWGNQTVRITAVMCHTAIDAVPAILQGKKAISLNEFDIFLADLKSRVRKYNEAE